MDRLELHEYLCEALGSRNVYYQPPNGLRMNLPAITYKEADPNTLYADDTKYKVDVSYDITVIHPDPDFNVANQILKLPMSRLGRRYISDNNYHDPILLYT